MVQFSLKWSDEWRVQGVCAATNSDKAKRPLKEAKRPLVSFAEKEQKLALSLEYYCHMFLCMYFWSYINAPATVRSTPSTHCSASCSSIFQTFSFSLGAVTSFICCCASSSLVVTMEGKKRKKSSPSSSASDITSMKANHFSPALLRFSPKTKSVIFGNYIPTPIANQPLSVSQFIFFLLELLLSVPVLL